MNRLGIVGLALVGWSGVGASSAWSQNSSPTGSSQTTEVRPPRPIEITLLQALRSNPATAPYLFSTEPRGSKIVLRGRVRAKIVHDVAIRMAIDLGVPVEDAIVIDTGLNAGRGGGFGPVPGPGPTLTGGVGFGGPPSFGNAGIGAGGSGGGGMGGSGGGLTGYGNGVGAYGGGMGGSGGGGYGGFGPNIPPVLGFPSAGSYGGFPSLIPPPIFGRYDDPFYGFDPPAVVYPPWWGALNAQRVQSNAGFNGTGNANNGAVGGGPGMVNNSVPGVIQGQGVAASPTGNGEAQNVAGSNLNSSNSSDSDIGPIPDGTIDMAIDGSGVATLRGGVPSLAEKIAIGQRVAQTSGVSQVVNLLTIKPSLSKMAAPAETTPPPPVPVEAKGTNPPSNPQAITSTPTQSPNNRGVASPPTGEVPTDASLTDRASRALADRAALLGSTVRVKVRDGVAQISGKVPSVYEAMMAYRSVQRTPGIRSIDDRLEFTVPDGSNGNPLIDKGRPDDVEPYLEAQIRRQVGDIAHVDRVRIQADALDLRGTLARPEDRDRFDAILRSMPILRGFQVHSDLPVATP